MFSQTSSDIKPRYVQQIKVAHSFWGLCPSSCYLIFVIISASSISIYWRRWSINSIFMQFLFPSKFMRDLLPRRCMDLYIRSPHPRAVFSIKKNRNASASHVVQTSKHRIKFNSRWIIAGVIEINIIVGYISIDGIEMIRRFRISHRQQVILVQLGALGLVPPPRALRERTKSVTI